MKQWGIKPTHTFEQLMVAYYNAVSCDLRSPERIIFALRRLKPFFEGKVMEELRRSDIAYYIEKRKAGGISNATINRELDVLSAAINHARYKWEWEIANPIERMSLKEPEGRLRWITRAEANSLIREGERDPKSPHLADFIRLALNTGCRKNELLTLEWDRVDLKANRLYLGGMHTKSGKRRIIPLNDEARKALSGRSLFRAEYCPDSPWVFAHKNGDQVKYMQRGFKAACDRAGILDFHVHDMRHTFASWLVMNGVPLLEVKELLGHSTIEMTERYAHLAPDNHVRAISVLDQLSRSGHGDGAVGMQQAY